MPYKTVIIRDNRVDAIKRRHPWIFSGAIKKHDDCKDGDIVKIETRRGECLGVGHFQDSSIMVRVLSFEDVSINLEYWQKKIGAAVELRKLIDLPRADTDVYRLIHGEGDGLPGLIIDVYGSLVVIQCHSIGMHKNRKEIAEALLRELGDRVEAIYCKSGNTLPSDYADDHLDEFLKGEIGEVQVKENGHLFRVNVLDGQKTGFFIDQRDNRLLLKKYASSKKVLNLFSYTGGFSVYALAGGADEVISVDVSQKAIDLCDENVALCKSDKKHEGLKQDVNNYLKEIEKNHFDLIVVDPPAFAKSKRKSHNAIQAYKRVNAAAIKKVKSGGLIFTFSCSQVIDAALFYNTITAAAIEAQRSCQVLFHLSQGADHPVSLNHPEGKYLKGLVVQVN